MGDNFSIRRVATSIGDVNKNNVIDADEQPAVERAEKALKALDANNDGFLSASEISNNAHKLYQPEMQRAYDELRQATEGNEVFRPLALAAQNSVGKARASLELKPDQVVARSALPEPGTSGQPSWSFQIKIPMAELERIKGKPVDVEEMKRQLESDNSVDIQQVGNFIEFNVDGSLAKAQSNLFMSTGNLAALSPKAAEVLGIPQVTAKAMQIDYGDEALHGKKAALVSVEGQIKTLSEARERAQQSVNDNRAFLKANPGADGLEKEDRRGAIASGVAEVQAYSAQIAQLEAKKQKLEERIRDHHPEPYRLTVKTGPDLRPEDRVMDSGRVRGQGTFDVPDDAHRETLYFKWIRRCCAGYSAPCWDQMESTKYRETIDENLDASLNKLFQGLPKQDALGRARALAGHLVNHTPAYDTVPPHIREYLIERICTAANVSRLDLPY